MKEGENSSSQKRCNKQLLPTLLSPIIINFTIGTVGREIPVPVAGESVVFILDSGVLFSPFFWIMQKRGVYQERERESKLESELKRE